MVFYVIPLSVMISTICEPRSKVAIMLNGMLVATVHVVIVDVNVQSPAPLLRLI